MEKGTTKYPLKKVVLKTFSIPRGNLSAVQSNNNNNNNNNNEVFERPFSNEPKARTTNKSNQNQDDLFLSQLSTRVLVRLVESSAFNRHCAKNPFNSRPHRLSFLSLFLEGKQIPDKPLTPNFEDKQQRWRELHQVQRFFQEGIVCSHSIFLPVC